MVCEFQQVVKSVFYSTSSPVVIVPYFDYCYASVRISLAYCIVFFQNHDSRQLPLIHYIPYFILFCRHLLQFAVRFYWNENLFSLQRYSTKDKEVYQVFFQHDFLAKNIYEPFFLSFALWKKKPGKPLFIRDNFVKWVSHAIFVDVFARKKTTLTCGILIKRSEY